jgi:hypothetical protein
LVDLPLFFRFFTLAQKPNQHTYPRTRIQITRPAALGAPALDSQDLPVACEQEPRSIRGRSRLDISPFFLSQCSLHRPEVCQKFKTACSSTGVGILKTRSAGCTYT